jgi:hypothetical protein
MSDYQPSPSKPIEDSDELSTLQDFQQAAAVAMNAVRTGELDEQLRAAVGLGSLAASALLNDQKLKPAEEVIIRLPVDGVKEPEDDDVTILDESSKRIGVSLG